MTTGPNIFDFATSELSQDAFLCWLLSWADPQNKATDKDLHNCGISFLKALFAKSNTTYPPEIIDVKVIKQKRHIDVLCIVNKTYPIIIEDKVDTYDHSNQLKLYYKEIKDRGYDPSKIISIYFKPRDQCNYESILKAKYTPFIREDMLKVLQLYNPFSNAILSDYAKSLENHEHEVSSFQNTKIHNWKYWSCVGFFKELHKAFPEAWWGWVNNKNGGFWCFGFAWNGNAGISIEHDAKSINTSLGIKIVEKDKSKQSAVRNQWSWDAIRVAKEEGIELKKPNRFGKGENMMVAITKASYRKTYPNSELIDMDATIFYLHKAKKLLAKISEFRESQSTE